MKRRTALKNIALTIGGTISLPAWAYKWNSTSIHPHQLDIGAGQEAILAEVVETIIPATDTPGAKKIGVHQFVLTMISDCYEKDVQENFINGLKRVEDTSRQLSGKSFVDCPSASRIEVLKRMEADSNSDKSQRDAFFPLVKELTIQGYLNSEYVMTNLLKYELVPGRFNGSVPVTK